MIQYLNKVNLTYTSIIHKSRQFFLGGNAEFANFRYLPIFLLQIHGSRMITRSDIVPRPLDSGRYVTTRSATRAAINSPMY